jgi:phage terminase large subunit-like protein
MDRSEQEQLLALAQEMGRRKRTDPLAQYKLHPKQQAFVESTLYGQAKENWFIAANRSGKSDAGAYIGATLARFGMEHSRVQANVDGTANSIQVRERSTSGWVSALDFPTARDVIQPKYFDNGFVPPGQRSPPFIPQHEIEQWRVDDQILKLKNGSLIGFKSADSGRRKYQGSEKDWLHMDEEHPWEIYEEAAIRVGARPLKFFCTATILPPEGMQTTVSWVFPKIINPWLEGKLQHANVFGASIYDNPGIDRGELARLEAIYPEGSTSRRIRMEGEWLPGIGGARAYPAFGRMLHVRDQEAHYSPYRALCWAWDFNVEPMASIVGQVDGGIYRVFHELTIEDASIPEMCELFSGLYDQHNGEIWIYGDATSERRSTQTGKTDYWVILQEMRRFRLSVRLRVPELNPKVPDRVNAVNRICKDERGLVRLQVDPSCRELITDLEGVLREDKGGIKKVRNRKDPYFRRTHWSDALGYWLAYEEPVRPPQTESRVSPSIPQPSYGFTGDPRGAPTYIGPAYPVRRGWPFN